MELRAPIPFPPAADAAEDTALTELEVAIALVSGGAALRVRIAGIASDIADRISGTGAVLAQDAGLQFVVERSGTSATFTVGPRG
jgi:hypothetical protein